MQHAIIPSVLFRMRVKELDSELGQADIRNFEVAPRQRFWWQHIHRDIANFVTYLNSMEILNIQHTVDGSPCDQ